VTIRRPEENSVLRMGMPWVAYSPPGVSDPDDLGAD
jgi:hypothetical protein